MNNVKHDENKIYQVSYREEDWVWARFDVKQSRYLAYVDLYDAIDRQNPDYDVSSTYLYNAIMKGDLVIGWITL